jgi:hypothetical protein
MRYKFSFLLVAAFFVTMNVLLWRSEFTARGRLGTPLPPEAVWEKVLTCPDNSFLEVRHKGVKIGRVHWAASINEAPVAQQLTEDELPPEGMVKTVTGYALDFDGKVSLEDLSQLGFGFGLKLSTNQTWKDMTLKVKLKPFIWEVHSSAETETLRITSEDDEGRQEQVLKFSELRDPDKLVRMLGGPTMPAVLGALGLPLNQLGKQQSLTNAPKLSLDLGWQARHDWLKVGRTPIRVYRIEAGLLGRFRAVFFVSPVGEILRVELPGEVVLMNEALISL